MSTTPITSVLVANRGEIARRVHHTARARGMTTVAVFSDADVDAPHTREADAAVRLPGNTPAETYLRGDLVIAAAQAAGADAIHPGYGFLSENAGFARDVIAAGLTWVGPPVAAIEAMGSKIEAKKMMAAAGVPMLSDLEPDAVTEDMLPVLVKASAGGGGRGMRVVRTLDSLHDEIAAARREAGSAFGDDAVFCERYLERGRHIEVQIMADAHGTVWAVGERECSIQRRHQKVIEEAPSPLVERTPGMREKLYTAARDAAAAIGYTGAGTVEFLATDDGEFFFLEMNTRLQVEHPVTEATTGLDLVALQFDVAAGLPLPSAEPPAAHGWSLEARLYAEDPANDYTPGTGTLWALDVPGVSSWFSGPHRPGIRLDSGVEPGPGGALIGVHYDPMLAKVISYGRTRAEACASLAGALARAKVHGLTTNRAQLVRVLRHPEFVAGNLSTAFLDDHGAGALAAPLADVEAVRISALAAAVVSGTAEHAAGPVALARPGFRNVGRTLQKRTFRVGEDELEVSYLRDRSGPRPVGELADVVGIEDVSADSAVLSVRGVRRVFTVARYETPGADTVVEVDSPLGPVSLVEPPRYTDPAAEVAAGSLLAPMPGAVIRVAVSVGDTVTAGQPLLWMEAMKMEHTIAAAVDGIVTELPVEVGTQVESGTVLAVVTEPGTDTHGTDTDDTDTTDPTTAQE
ncbi:MULTISPECIES: ATP-binding protein [Dietzia]|uniref:ATP-binding protein n=1 Tax=Dietzia TaxID=37914 RepID=UPI00078461B2|nr:MULTISPECIES: biotin carboxylase N-terminal domain-containing protein [Dietzia]KZO58212.1 acetyl/propionyl-CoA carboxylase subuit alpha [Dietzia maris]MCT2057716.1 ATP-grasp domain-containing protein [Dietzia cinnamea]MCT2120304.1 ATP-grasp domain-containing protein [Dietzia cinnamea]MCT2143693.1 ATP-grasp domain-containing protein [Dietzia cinnamea]MCT2304235.1 ATP-grasp domain-containing protein [Dietzia cinnamea]